MTEAVAVMRQGGHGARLRLASVVLAVCFMLVLASCGEDGGATSRQLVAIVDPVAVSEDEITLEIFVPSCNGRPEVEVVEDSETVWIEVTTKVTDGGDACLDFAVVELDQPLAGRQVKDRVSGEVLRLEFLELPVEAEPRAPSTTVEVSPAYVEGVASIRFTDDRESAVEVCVTYVDPTTSESDILCAPTKSELWTAQRNLPFELRHDAQEYFRDDAATSLVQIGPGSLPLVRGDRGELVELAQRGLQAFCFHIDDAVTAMRPDKEFPSSTPGEFDDITEFMVRRAQAQLGLTVDGVYGPATHASLLAEAVNNTPSNEGCFA